LNLAAGTPGFTKTREAMILPGEYRGTERYEYADYDGGCGGALSNITTDFKLIVRKDSTAILIRDSTVVTDINGAPLLGEEDVLTLKLASGDNVSIQKIANKLHLITTTLCKDEDGKEYTATVDMQLSFDAAGIVSAFENKNEDNQLTYPEFVEWLFGKGAADLYGVQVSRSDSLFLTRERVNEGKDGEELYSFEGSHCFLVLRADNTWSYLPLAGRGQPLYANTHQFADGVQGTYSRDGNSVTLSPKYFGALALKSWSLTPYTIVVDAKPLQKITRVCHHANCGCMALPEDAKSDSWLAPPSEPPLPVHTL